jgi:hypothetical protein
MQFRNEALATFRANEMSVFKGPPAKAYLPRVRGGKVLNQPPLWQHVIPLMESMPKHACVLEIGPGKGVLAQFLQSRYGSKVGRYLALERDRQITGPYERITSIAAADAPVDLAIASEVAEHMSADDFYAHILRPLSQCMSTHSAFVGSVPNPMTPGGIARDFSHVQWYPWYDLYAILRLQFEEVRIYRTHYLWTLPRLLFLLPRMLVCAVQELDWCDGLVWVARNPRKVDDQHAS